MAEINADNAQMEQVDEGKNSCEKSDRALHTGLLILRLGLGIIFIAHGLPKLTGGPEVWTRIGGAMSIIGIDFAPVFWGLMAALVETLGGLLLAVGLFVRPAALFLLFTMVMAVLFLLNSDADFSKWSHPATMAIVFASLIIMSGGRYSLGAMIPGLRDKCWR